MESEFQILENIEKNNTATQRDIAKNTGMSLGNVNTLIKRLVKKGFLKMERLNAKTIRYILTPKGIKEKAEQTYKYVVASYRYFNEMNEKIDAVIESCLGETSKEVFLLGEKDEIYELLESRLNYAKIRYSLVRSEDELKNKDVRIVLVWHPDYAEILERKRVEHINLLEII